MTITMTNRTVSTKEEAIELFHQLIEQHGLQWTMQTPVARLGRDRRAQQVPQ